MLAAIATVFTSCEKDDPEVPNEEELITTVVLTLEPRTGGDAVVLKFQDLDGEGGNPPVITSGELKDGVTYDGEVEFLNEQEDPAEDITEEVEEEGTEHQVFYEVVSSGNVDVEYQDVDLEGNPLGLEITLTASGAPADGTLTIILRHEPKKPNNGTPSDAGGETDVEAPITFSIVQ